MSQRDRLAKLVHEADCEPCDIGPESYAYQVADTLIASGVRIVDVLSLSYALGSMRPKWSQHRTHESAAAAILAAFDRQSEDDADAEAAS